MTIRYGLIAAAALVCAATAFAQEHKGSATPPNATSAKAETFRELDKNHDGFIDSKEASAASGLVAMLPSLDTNKDGKLSSAEYAKHAKKN